MDVQKRQTSLTLLPLSSSQFRNDALSVASPLSEKAITDFQSLYFKKYSIHLSGDQAKEKALNLLSFLRRIGYPLGEKRL